MLERNYLGVGLGRCSPPACDFSFHRKIAHYIKWKVGLKLSNVDDTQPASLTIVTLSRNNPDELRKTLRSIALQSEQPDLHLVIDGSDTSVAPEMSGLAMEHGSDYHWIAPQGIYNAMRASLRFVPSNSFVWWLNSSDWLAGKDSVRIARAGIGAVGGPAGSSWIVGQLVRRRGNASGIYPVGYSGKKFVLNMRFGKIGFPHPSTLFGGDHLRDIDAFSGGFSIAEDYSLALEFGNRFGPPHILKLPIAVHVPGGVSFQRPVRNLLEKSIARLRSVSERTGWAEFVSFAGTAPRGVWRRLRKSDVGEPVPIELWQSRLWGSIHFCEAQPDAQWPSCCDAVL